MTKAKPYAISKQTVWDAYKKACHPSGVPMCWVAHLTPGSAFSRGSDFAFTPGCILPPLQGLNLERPLL